MESGFTLVEVLLSLALLAGLMTAMSQLVFSLVEVSLKNQAQFVFARHARAVAHHLDDLLRVAANTAHASNAIQGGPTVGEVQLPTGETAVLTFDLPAGDRLLAWAAQTLPESSCALAWNKDEGLVLYWKSRLAAAFDHATLRKVIVSPLVTKITYDCFDSTTKQWIEQEVLQKDAKGDWPRPRRLRLRFARDGRELEESIVLPVRSQGVPAY